MVGAAIGYGLARAGAKVNVLDQGDSAFRAARGNFGLTWVQSKGLGAHPYFLLSRNSVDAWAELAEELREHTGVDVAYKRTGGLTVCLGEKEASDRRDFIARFRVQEAEGGYDCRFVERDELQQLIPRAALGPTVTGASFSPMDGHANPLFLLRALLAGIRRAEGRYTPLQSVERIDRSGSAYTVVTADARWHAPKVVVAAGLGTQRLAAMVGLDVPVRAQRGQQIATERAKPVFHHAMSGVRQTQEGSVLIGYTQEDVGLNNDTTVAGLRSITRRAIASFPLIARLRLVRAWAALRVLTPDGRPIYAESATHPGAYVATCHSGVTLAAAHARLFPDWVLAGRAPEPFASFGPERFHVQAAN